MAYIPSHLTLRNHPKMKRLARILRISEPCAIGHLHMFWWWCLDYANNGDLTSRDKIDIAIGAGWSGDEDVLFAVLVECGFIDQTDDGSVVVHDWSDYGGKYQEFREKDRERKRTARLVQRTGDGCPQDGPLSRGDKKRVNNSPLPPKGMPPGFEDFWAIYPKKRSKGEAIKAWAQTKDLRPDLPALIEIVKAARQSFEWTKDGGRYIPNPATWLRAQGWTDDVPQNGVYVQPGPRRMEVAL